MVQSLQESDLLQHLLPAQQLLVYVFGRNCALAPSLVAPLGHREATPEEQRRPSSEGQKGGGVVEEHERHQTDLGGFETILAFLVP